MKSDRIEPEFLAEIIAYELLTERDKRIFDEDNSEGTKMINIILKRLDISSTIPINNLTLRVRELYNSFIEAENNYLNNLLSQEIELRHIKSYMQG